MDCNIDLTGHSDLYQTDKKLLDIKDVDWNEITRWLRTELLPKGLDLNVSEPLIEKLLLIINRIIDKFLWYNCLEVAVAETLTETIKILRLYVTNDSVAAYLVEQTLFYDIFNRLMMCLFTKKNGPELYTKYLLQLFLNILSVGNDEQKQYTRHRIRGHSFVQNFHALFYFEYGHLYEVSAVLYNLYYDTELNDEGLITYILKYHADKNKTNEYLDFLVEKVISEDYMWKNYEHVSYSRLELLHCLREMFISPDSSNLIIQVRHVPQACLECFVNVFNKCAHVVFQVTQQGDATATEEVSMVLELLAHLSSEEKYLQYLQSHKDVLINAGVLLINAHRLGKAPGNAFSPIQKLSELQNPSENVRRNGVFGFKADLVRLIGNLCWKNKNMQNLARECELIPVLLDSCNMDAKNPFIIQWVIFAIRNICENNKDNQAVIAGLSQQGVVSSEVLREFGLTLHSEGDLSVGIMQLNINKK